MHDILQKLSNVPTEHDTLSTLREFDLSDSTAGQRSQIAEYRVRRPLRFRDEKPVKLAIPAYETFSTDGSGTQQTHNLSNDLVDSPNTDPFLLYSDGTEVDPDSVDFAGDSFNYTDGGTVEELDVFYTCAEDGNIVVEKEKPRSSGQITREVFSFSTLLGNVRNQHEEGVSLEVGEDPMHPVVPQDWYIRVYLDASWSFKASVSRINGTATPKNFLFEIPIHRNQQTVEGLADVVSASIAGVPLSQAGQGRGRGRR